MVMELLDGIDLAALLSRRGLPLDVEDAVDFVLQACEALAEAHALGIVHRDLKPENLFLTRRADGSHLVKLIDFGISSGVELTMGGGEGGGEPAVKVEIMGSPGYMSPEQVRDFDDVDARADVWSLGAILYELLTRPPGSRRRIDRRRVGPDLLLPGVVRPHAPRRPSRRARWRDRALSGARSRPAYSERGRAGAGAAPVCRGAFAPVGSSHRRDRRHAQLKPVASGRAVADHANQELEVDRLGHERRAGVTGLLDGAVVGVGADDHRAKLVHVSRNCPTKAAPVMPGKR